MPNGYLAERSAVRVITAALVASAIALAGLAVPAGAVPPPPTDTTSVIEVFVGADRDAVGIATGLAGVTLQLHDGGEQGPTTPVAEPWATCVSDDTGSCFFVVPGTQVGGPNRDRRFWVVRTGAPSGWFAVDVLQVGGSSRALAPYRFRTPGMTARTNFFSGDRFMNDHGVSPIRWHRRGSGSPAAPIRRPRSSADATSHSSLI